MVLLAKEGLEIVLNMPAIGVAVSILAIILLFMLVIRRRLLNDYVYYEAVIRTPNLAIGEKHKQYSASGVGGKILRKSRRTQKWETCPHDNGKWIPLENKEEIENIRNSIKRDEFIVIYL